VARIAGVDIPRDKRIEIALTYVYGIGLTRAQKIIAKSGVNPDIRVKDLDDADVQKLRAAVESFTLEGDLRRQEGIDMQIELIVKGKNAWTGHGFVVNWHKLFVDYGARSIFNILLCN
jgi:ribosomal protein uS13